MCRSPPPHTTSRRQARQSFLAPYEMQIRSDAPQRRFGTLLQAVSSAVLKQRRPARARYLRAADQCECTRRPYEHFARCDALVLQAVARMHTCKPYVESDIARCDLLVVRPQFRTCTIPDALRRKPRTPTWLRQQHPTPHQQLGGCRYMTGRSGKASKHMARSGVPHAAKCGRHSLVHFEWESKVEMPPTFCRVGYFSTFNCIVRET
jgi:hypothetical protein